MSWTDRVFGATKEPEQTFSAGPDFSVSDPALATFLLTGMAGMGELNAWTALKQPAYFRGVSIIATTIASMPVRTWHDDGDGLRSRSTSFLETNPSGPYNLSRFTFYELALTTLLTQGECGFYIVRNNADTPIGLMPVSPLAYSTRWVGARKQYRVTDGAGQTHDWWHGEDFISVLGLTLDGLRGVSPMLLFRDTLGLAQAQDRAAYAAMRSGLLFGGLVSPAEGEDVESDELKAIKTDILQQGGPDNANGVLAVNRRLQFKEWVAPNKDLTYVEGREFSVSEVARMLGIPEHMLAMGDKTSSWGRGIQEQGHNLSRYTLSPWSGRLEVAFSDDILVRPRYIEWDYSALVEGTPAEYSNMLSSQVAAGWRTPNEARRAVGLPDIAGGDTLRLGPAPAPAPLDTSTQQEGNT